MWIFTGVTHGILEGSSWLLSTASSSSRLRESLGTGYGRPEHRCSRHLGKYSEFM